MKSSELFGVCVRVTGFLILIYGMWEILGGFENLVENFLAAAQDESSETTSSFAYFAFGIPAFVWGALCFFFADWIVRLAYRHPPV